MKTILFSIFILIFISIFSTSTVSSKNLNIVFWLEAVQTDITDDIAKAVNEIEALNLGLEIRDSTVVVHNEDFDNEPNALSTFCKILSTEGSSLIIDLTYYPWQAGLDLLATYQIPYIKVERFMTPFLQMFGEFLRQKGGNDVFLILQNEQDKNEVMFQMVDGFPFRTMLINGIEEKYFIRRIDEVRPIPGYFAVLAKSSNMNLIFEKLIKGKVFKRPVEWHFVFMDTRHQIFKYAPQAENSTQFTLNSKAICQLMKQPETYCLSGFTLQRAVLVDIFRSLALFADTAEESLLPMKLECEDFNNETSESEKSLYNLVSELKFSEFLTISEKDIFEEANDQPVVSFRLNVSISTFVNASDNDRSEPLAVWKNGEILKINRTISPAKRFFRIGTIEAIPWSYYRRNSTNNEILLDENGTPIWEGYCVDFVDTLAVKLNFEYEFISPLKGKFGDRDENTGLWDGIVGDLVTGETDFAVTALKMYSEREEVIDFIAPYFDQTGISIVMRKPVRQTSLFKFMTVLRLEVWMSIGGALVATSVMIWLLDKYSPYSSRNNPEAYPYPCREFTLRESFWFALTSFTPQGGGEAPKAVSGRFLVAAYWLFVVLMLATFTANLAAFLTVERMQTPVQNLDQLARQSRINYTVVADSDTHQYFINMKFAEDTLYRMWKELALNASKDFHKYRVWDYPIKEQYGHILIAINSSEPVKNAARGFQKVTERENADFAFIHDSSEIKYEITQNCNLTEVGDVFAEQPYAVAVQQGSHLTDELSYAILELQKDRYFEELKAKYWNNSRIKECSSSEESEGITLESLGGVFIATLFGLGLAMVTLAFEVCYYKKRDDIGGIRKRFLKTVSKITKVKPYDSTVGNRVESRPAWENVPNLAISTKTPPPSFESATFDSRGRQLPSSITLGGEQFRPRNLNQRERIARPKTRNKFQSDLPAYLE